MIYLYSLFFTFISYLAFVVVVSENVETTPWLPPTPEKGYTKVSINLAQFRNPSGQNLVGYHCYPVDASGSNICSYSFYFCIESASGGSFRDECRTGWIYEGASLLESNNEGTIDFAKYANKLRTFQALTTVEDTSFKGFFLKFRFQVFAFGIVEPTLTDSLITFIGPGSLSSHQPLQNYTLDGLRSFNKTSLSLSATLSCIYGFEGNVRECQESPVSLPGYVDLMLNFITYSNSKGTNFKGDHCGVRCDNFGFEVCAEQIGSYSLGNDCSNWISTGTTVEPSSIYVHFTNKTYGNLQNPLPVRVHNWEQARILINVYDYGSRTPQLVDVMIFSLSAQDYKIGETMSTYQYGLRFSNPTDFHINATAVCTADTTLIGVPRCPDFIPTTTSTTTSTSTSTSTSTTTATTTSSASQSTGSTVVTPLHSTASAPASTITFAPTTTTTLAPTTTAPPSTTTSYDVKPPFKGFMDVTISLEHYFDPLNSIHQTCPGAKCSYGFQYCFESIGANIDSEECSNSWLDSGPISKKNSFNFSQANYADWTNPYHLRFNNLDGVFLKVKIVKLTQTKVVLNMYEIEPLDYFFLPIDSELVTVGNNSFKGTIMGHRPQNASSLTLQVGIECVNGTASGNLTCPMAKSHPGPEDLVLDLVSFTNEYGYLFQQRKCDFSLTECDTGFSVCIEKNDELSFGLDCNGVTFDTTKSVKNDTNNIIFANAKYGNLQNPMYYQLIDFSVIRIKLTALDYSYFPFQYSQRIDVAIIDMWAADWPLQRTDSVKLNGLRFYQPTSWDLSLGISPPIVTTTGPPTTTPTTPVPTTTTPFIPPSPISGYSEVTITLLTYENVDGLLFSGQRCIAEYTSCNLAFEYCLEGASTGSFDPTSCSSQWLSMDLTVPSGDNIKFNSSQTYGDWKNPFILKFNNWQGFFLKFKISERFIVSSPLSTVVTEQFTLVDRIVTFIGSNTISASNTDMMLWLTGTRDHYPSKLAMSANFHCAVHNGFECLPPNSIPGVFEFGIDLLSYTIPVGTKLLNYTICRKVNTLMNVKSVSLDICLEDINGMNSFDLKCQNPIKLFSIPKVTANKCVVTFAQQDYNTWKNPSVFLVENLMARRLKIQTKVIFEVYSFMLDTFVYDFWAGDWLYGNPVNQNQVIQLKGQRDDFEKKTTLFMNITTKCKYQGSQPTLCLTTPPLTTTKASIVNGTTAEGPTSSTNTPALTTTEASVVTVTTAESLIKGNELFLLGDVSSNDQDGLATNFLTVVCQTTASICTTLTTMQSTMLTSAESPTMMTSSESVSTMMTSPGSVSSTAVDSTSGTASTLSSSVRTTKVATPPTVDSTVIPITSASAKTLLEAKEDVDNNGQVSFGGLKIIMTFTKEYSVSQNDVTKVQYTITDKATNKELSQNDYSTISDNIDKMPQQEFDRELSNGLSQTYSAIAQPNDIQTGSGSSSIWNTGYWIIGLVIIIISQCN